MLSGAAAAAASQASSKWASSAGHMVGRRLGALSQRTSTWLQVHHPQHVYYYDKVCHVWSVCQHGSVSCVSHPLVAVQVARRLGQAGGSGMQYLNGSRRYGASTSSVVVVEELERQSSCVSRLYARHCLELLALSAATQRSICRLEEGKPPSMLALSSQPNSSIPAKPASWSLLQNSAPTEDEEYLGLAPTRFGRWYNAILRMTQLSLLASPLLLLTPLSYLSSHLYETTWSYALWSVDKAGPTFTKLAQWATTRADLFPAEFVSRFAKLQDSTQGHSWHQTHTMLTQAFGPNYQTETLSIDPHAPPIGSGCVAQVYRGTLQRPIGLLPTHSDVAIKVQHPHITQKVLVDFYILRKFAKLLEWIPTLNLDYLSVADSVQQFRSVMLPQLDMECEARNLTRFRKDFADEEGVTFPQPLYELTSTEILVETFMHGEPILNYLQPQHSKEDRQALATEGLSMAMKMIFLHDFVHGDLHPGNILVDRVPSKKKKNGRLRLNVIDCGLVIALGEREHRNLVEILGSFIKRDGMHAGQLMIDTAKKCQASEQDVQLFCQGIERICSDDEENNFLECIGDYLADICYLACKHKVKLEACFINAALACEIMEGIACSLYPDMEVQQIALPMVFRAEVMHGMKNMRPAKIFMRGD